MADRLSNPGLGHDNPTVETHTSFENIEPDMDLIDSMSDSIAKAMRTAGWEENDIDAMKDAFEEAFVNAIAHGTFGIKKENDSDDLKALSKQAYKDTKTDKKIHIRLDVDNNRAIVVVRDEGPGFDWKNVPDPTAQENLMKTSGRGTLFMKFYMNEVNYNEAGNEITLIKYKDKKTS